MNKKDIDTIRYYFKTIKFDYFYIHTSVSEEMQKIKPDYDILIDHMLKECKIPSNNIRFKNLSLQKQYNVLKFIFSYPSVYYIMHTINKLYDDYKMSNKIFKFIFSKVSHYPRINLLNKYSQYLTFETYHWVLNKQIFYYNYFNIKNNKLKKQIDELYKFLKI